MQGKVVDNSGAPISGVEIRLTPLSGGMQPSGPAYTAVTDDSGGFVLDNIAPYPRLGLAGRKTGYQNFRYGSASQAAPTVPIPIVAGESLTGLVLVMELQGVLSGRVVNPKGDPIANAIVVATNTSGARTLPITGTTNDRGEFRIFGLTTGSYYLAAQSLLGNLTGAPPITTSTTMSMTTYYPGVTNRDLATALDVTEGQQTTGLVIPIVQSTGYMVRGTLTPVPTGGITAISATLSQTQANPLAALTGTTAILEAGGAFALGPLAPGEYQVRATSIGGGRTGIVGAAVVTVVNADLAGVTLAPLRTYTVTGKVALEDGTVEQLIGAVAGGAARGGTGGRGAAAPGGPALTLTPKETGGTATAVRATFGPDGAFTFENLQPGLYTLASPNFMAIYLKSLIWAGEDVISSQLRIESGGEMKLTYRRGAVRVTGNAKDADGKPPAGATALIWPVEPRRISASDGSRASAIDANGAFAMPAIPPGLYYAAAFPGINGVTALEPRFHRQFNGVATKFEILENMPVTLDIQAVTAEKVNEALKKPQ